jgi:ABC-type cobalamin/Fe3+-siderophores transport system ATPase subunit
MIHKATIAYLKAFGEQQTISFSSSDREGDSKLTLLVGPNNSGKSTVLKALEELLIVENPLVFTVAKEHRHGDKQPALSVQHGVQEIKIVPSPGSKFLVDGKLEAVRPLIRSIPSRRPWSELFSATQTESDYRNAARHNRKNNRHWIDSNFGGALMMLSLDKIKKDEFNALLKQVDPSMQDWRTETAGGQDFIEYYSESGGWHRIGDVGDGVSSLFRICFELLHLKKSDTLLIDEPELSLHPQTQRRLANLIICTALQHQIIVATHSPHFISWSGLKKGVTVHRFNMTSRGANLSYARKLVTA